MVKAFQYVDATTKEVLLTPIVTTPTLHAWFELGTPDIYAKTEWLGRKAYNKAKARAKAAAEAAAMAAEAAASSATAEAAEEAPAAEVPLPAAALEGGGLEQAPLLQPVDVGASGGSEQQADIGQAIEAPLADVATSMEVIGDAQQAGSAEEQGGDAQQQQHQPASEPAEHVSSMVPMDEDGPEAKVPGGRPSSSGGAVTRPYGSGVESLKRPRGASSQMSSAVTPSNSPVKKDQRMNEVNVII